MSLIQLILRIISKLTANIINKSLRIFKVFSKESFEFGLYDKSNAIVIVLVLGLSETDGITEK